MYFFKMSQSIFHRSSLALRSGLLRSNGGQRIFQGSFRGMAIYNLFGVVKKTWDKMSCKVWIICILFAACSTTTSESSDSKLPKENYFFNWKVMRELKRLNSKAVIRIASTHNNSLQCPHYFQILIIQKCFESRGEARISFLLNTG